MSTYTWTVDADGNWSTATNWSPAGPPPTGQDVEIATADFHTITHDSGDDLIGGLTLGNDALVISGGSTLEVTGAFSNSGTIDVALGTFEFNTGGQSSAGAFSIGSNGTLLAASSIVIGNGVRNAGLIETTGGGLIINGAVANAGGTLWANGSNILLEGGAIEGGTLATSGGAVVEVPGANNAGTLDGSGAAVVNTGMVLVGSNNTILTLLGTIDNEGSIEAEGTSFTSTIAIGGTVSLTGGGTLTLIQNGGDAVLIANAAATLINGAGNTIDGADQLGSDTDLTIVNAGTIDATDANNALVLDTGAVVTTNTGILEATAAGGLVLRGTINNSGTIVADGGNVALEGAVIEGGILATPGGVIVVPGGSETGTLDGTKSAVFNTGTIQVGSNNTILDLLGTIDNSGLIEAEGTSYTSTIVTSGTVTLTGGGTLRLIQNGGDAVLEGSGTLVNSAGNLIEGADQLGNGTGLTIINAGTIDATDPTALVINVGTATLGNSGLIEATSGVLVIQSTIANSGTIAADGNDVLLEGATIEGGVLTSSGGAVVDLPGNTGTSTLDGAVDAVTNTGTILVGSNNAFLDLVGTIDNQGLIEAEGTSFTSTIGIGGTVTLTGGGILDLIQNGGDAVLQGPGTLVNSAGNLIEGADQLGDGTDLTIVNAGTIDATDPNVLVLNTGPAITTNTGLIEATGAGGLVISGTIANKSTIAANGGNIYLEGGVIEGGTLATLAGVIAVPGGGGTGTLDGTAATVFNTGTVQVGSNNTILELLGTIDNSGLIDAEGTSFTSTIAIGGTVALTGGGTLDLIQNGGDAALETNGAAATLINGAGNLIEGADQLGNGTDLTIVNAGTVDATDPTALILNTGSAITTNTGLIEATGAGGLVISGTIANKSTIFANGGNVYLEGGVIEGGTLATLGGVIAVPGANETGTLDGTAATVFNTGTIQVGSNNTILELQGAIDNSGLIEAEGTSFTSTIAIGGTVTLLGGGTVDLIQNGGDAALETNGAAATLINGVDNTIDGADQLGSGTDLTIENDGTINATDGTALVLYSTALTTNTGLIEATGVGGLVLRSTIANAGTISAAGGNVLLHDGVIEGGILTTSGGGIIAVPGANYTGTLDGTASPVTNLGTIQVGSNNTILDLVGTIDNSGLIEAEGTSFTSTIVVAGIVTVASGGSIQLIQNGGDAVLEGTGTLVNATGGLIEGADQLGNGSALTIANSGTIDATDPFDVLTINTAAVPLGNAGLIEATTGSLVINSTIANTGTIAAETGTVFLESGVIAGGTLASSGGGAIVVPGANQTGTLDGSGAPVINTGTVLVGSNNTILNLLGTIENEGLIEAEGTSFTSSIVLTGTVTLDGGVLDLIQNGGDAALETNGAAATLVIAAGTTIEGADQLGNGTDLTIQNDGTIDASDPNNALIINIGAASLNNAGLIEATAGNLTINRVITNAGGTISANGGNVLLEGGLIQGGMLSSVGGNAIEVPGANDTGTLDGTASAVVTSGTLLVGSNNTILDLFGTIDNDGLIEAEGTSFTSTIVVNGTVTLGGTGTLDLIQNGGDAALEAAGAAATLVIAAGATIDGADQLGAGTNLSIQNDGTIDASDPNNALIINIGAASLTNAGLIEATAGNLTINRVIANAGGTVAANGGNVLLEGGVIQGGTLASFGANLVEVPGANNTGTLDGTASAVVTSGTVLVGSNNTALDLFGTIENEGLIEAEGTSFTSSIVLTGTVTLDGGVLDLIQNGGDAALETNGAAATLVIAAGTTIEGADQLGNGTDLTIQNDGTIDASDPNNALIINIGAASLTNAGLIEATAGNLTINRIITNAGGTIAANGGNVLLEGGLIQGGTLASSAGSLIEVPGANESGTLDGTASAVVNAGTIQVGSNNTILDLIGTIDNDGLIEAEGTSFTSTIAIGGTVTLGGTGTLDLIQNGGDAAIAANGTAATLVIGAGATIDGADQLGDGTDLSIQNDGTIDASDPNNALVINLGAGTLSNAGLIEATAGNLTINRTIANAGGMVAANGGNILLEGGVIDGGTLSSSGTNLIEIPGANDTGTLDGTGSAVVTTGTLLVGSNNTVLDLFGTIDDEGLIEAEGTSFTSTIAIGGTVALDGTGTLALIQNGGDAAVEATGTAATLVNGVGHLIDGADQLGAGTELAIDNAGTIDASDPNNALVINIGTALLANSGLIEATAHGLTIDRVVANAGGTIAAYGSDITLTGADIEGGTLASSGASILDMTGDSTLDGSAQALTNSGTLTIASGVTLAAIGDVVNTGTIGGSGTIDVAGPGSLTNVGTISGPSVGVMLAAGGALDNAGFIAATGSLGFGVIGGGSIVNSGTIDGLGNGPGGSYNPGGIYLNAGGFVSNASAGLIYGAQIGIKAANGGGTIENAGTIKVLGQTGNAGVGILLDAGGTIFNAGTIEDTGPRDDAVRMLNGGTFLNAGLIEGAATYEAFGVVAFGGATSTVAAGGTVLVAGLGATGFVQVGGRLENAGLIEEAGEYQKVGYGVAVYSKTAAITNTGSLVATGVGGIGAQILGGSLTNAAAGRIESSGTSGIGLDLQGGVASNLGTIQAAGSAGIAVRLEVGGTLSNAGYAGGLAGGVLLTAGGSVSNSGTIAATGTGAGVYLSSGGTVTNTGLIEATSTSGVGVYAHGGSVANSGVVRGGNIGVEAYGGVVTDLAGGTIEGVTGIVFVDGLGTTASPVTLESAGTIEGTGGVAVQFGAGDDLLKVDAGASFTGRVDGGGGINTLDLAAGSGTLGYLGTSFTQFGVVEVDGGGQWMLTGANLLAGTVSLTDAGDLTVTGSLTNDGTITVSGGSLTDRTALAGYGTIEIANHGSVHLVSGATAGTIAFADATGTLTLDDATGFSMTLAGFVQGDTLDLSGISYSTEDSATLADDTLLVEQNGTFVAEFTMSGLPDGATFAVESDGHGGTDIVETSDNSSGGEAACYCAGTRIWTARGDIPVEDLVTGDLVATLAGAFRPIRWIGTRSYDPARIEIGRDTILPIVIQAGALSPGTPERDLAVSPEHCLYLAGSLIPARFLVNGASITRRRSLEPVTYFHIELDAHEVIYAEGALAESYRENSGNRTMFENGAEITSREMEPCAPLVWDGPVLTEVRQALRLQAETLGYGTTFDPDLRLLVDGVPVRATSSDGYVYRFELDRPARDIRLVSRSAVPAETGDAPDHRRLGINLERLVLASPTLRIEIGHGEPSLTDGFHADEPTHRWTNGDAAIPERFLNGFGSSFTIEVHTLGVGLAYPENQPPALTGTNRKSPPSCPAEVSAR